MDLVVRRLRIAVVALVATLATLAAPDDLAANRITFSGATRDAGGLVGRGSSGPVLRFPRSGRGKRRVVVKLVRDAELAAHEVSNLRRVDGVRGVSPLVEVGRDESGATALAIGKARGVDLKQLAASGGLSIHDQVDAVRQVAHIVQRMHDRGVHHLDVKPANVVVRRTKRGRLSATLIDLGLGQPRGAESGESGTPEMMAPESWSRGTRTDQTDVFSIGLMLRTLVTGRFVLSADDVDDVVDAAMMRDPTARTVTMKLAYVRAFARPYEADPALKAIIAKATQFDPADRYRSAGELAGALARWHTANAPR